MTILLCGLYRTCAEYTISYSLQLSWAVFSEFGFVADILARTEAFGVYEEVEQFKQMWSCLDIVVSCGLPKECNCRECSSEVFHATNKGSGICPKIKHVKSISFFTARERDEVLLLMS